MPPKRVAEDLWLRLEQPEKAEEGKERHDEDRCHLRCMHVVCTCVHACMHNDRTLI